jgi:hypothetical protein
MPYEYWYKKQSKTITEYILLVANSFKFHFKISTVNSDNLYNYLDTLTVRSSDALAKVLLSFGFITICIT